MKLVKPIPCITSYCQQKKTLPRSPSPPSKPVYPSQPQPNSPPPPACHIPSGCGIQGTLQLCCTYPHARCSPMIPHISCHA